MHRLLKRWKFERTVRATLKLLPADGDIQGLLAHLGAVRGRPVIVLPKDDHDDATSGRWYKTEFADYITSDIDAAPSSEAITLCHEVGHIVLDHSGAENTLAEAVAPDVDPGVAGRVLAMRERHNYDKEVEQEAEQLGTILAAEARRRQRVAQFSNDPVSRRLR
jgi:hypothetical protein